MKEYIEVTRTVKRTVLNLVKCDICGISTTDEGNWFGRTLGIEEVSISYRKGENYSDGGSFVKTTFELCPKCFKEELLPFLAKQGAFPTVTEVDY